MADTLIEHGWDGIVSEGWGGSQVASCKCGWKGTSYGSDDNKRMEYVDHRAEALEAQFEAQLSRRY